MTYAIDTRLSFYTIAMISFIRFNWQCFLHIITNQCNGYLEKRLKKCWSYLTLTFTLIFQWYKVLLSLAWVRCYSCYTKITDHSSIQPWKCLRCDSRTYSNEVRYCKECGISTFSAQLKLWWLQLANMQLLNELITSWDKECLLFNQQHQSNSSVPLNLPATFPFCLSLYQFMI